MATPNKTTAQADQALSIALEGKAPEMIKEALEDISEAAQALLNGPLTEDAVILLIWDMLPTSKRPSRRTIRTVLEAASLLSTHYVKAT